MTVLNLAVFLEHYSLQIDTMFLINNLCPLPDYVCEWYKNNEKNSSSKHEEIIILRIVSLNISEHCHARQVLVSFDRLSLK